MTLPDDVDVGKFLLSDGKLDGKPLQKSKLRTLRQFKDAFSLSIPEGALEANTLSLTEIHFRHLFKILGKSFELRSLSLEDLQRYVDQRSQHKGIRGKNLSPVTIKKEITSLRSLWNWAKHSEHLNRPFPSRGLRYPKAPEKPPFQTMEQINQKIAAYELSPEKQADLWECLFLTSEEVCALLDCVRQVASHPCLYPMFFFAAHTGARRSEILRSQVEDIDLIGETITIREKKRLRGRHTTRTVPISADLRDVLEEWLENHLGIGPTFSLGVNVLRTKKKRTKSERLTVNEAQHHFKRTLANTEWASVRGWHVFRHSFCSNCAAAGIDQRVINAWVGHQTEEMVKRYRHLIPNQQQQAIARVFGRSN